MAGRAVYVRHRGVAAAILAAVLYFALHVPFLARAPDDIDATNFLLALRSYDVREHQPHPPGYPVFIAAAHVARAGVAALGPFTGPLDADSVNLYSLAACSALFGALTVFPLVVLWRAIDGDHTRALFAALLTIASPLFWYTGVRPLSDLPGIAVAATSLGLLVPLVLVRAGGRPALRLFAGAAVAGIAVGVRAQTLWMTGPALAVAAVVMLWRRDLRAAALIGGGFGIGLAIWAVPLVTIVGGPRAFLDLLTAQAADDLRGAILAASFSARGLAAALRDTFLLPWGGPWLAVCVLMLALAGSLRLLWEKPRAVAVIAIVFGPYLALHLFFHSTSHTRYAIPLVVPIAYLAVSGLSPVTRLRQMVALALVVIAVSSSMGPIVTQARSGSPLARAWADVRSALPTAATRPVIGMHHAVQRQLRFVTFDDSPLQAPARYEWLAVVDHFRSGGTAPVWFLASALRSDLVLFDPAATRAVRKYDWSFAPRALLGAVRPGAVVWYEITRPGWMAAEGWSLTPETRGVAERSRRSPAAGGAVAYIARRPEAAVLMIGGRNLGGTCLTAARLEATLDGQPVGTWDIPAGLPFAHFVNVPVGALDGEGYAELHLRASDLSGAGLGVDVALEQFDVQSGRRPVVALGPGWYEPELEVDTGERWRWTKQRATVMVRHFGRDVVLAIRADDPTRTLGRAVTLQVRAAGRLMASRRFDRAVEWHVRIPSEVIGESGGSVTLISEAAFVPDRKQRNGDMRELSLRVLDVAVEFSDDNELTAGR
jgi:hypothetical protein